MFTDGLLMRRPFLDERPGDAMDWRRTRRRLVAGGAVAGLGVGLIARLWMRTLTEQEPVFSVGGTLFILLVFSGLGTCSGLALAWRRSGSSRRMLFQRGVALLPTLFMGPFVPLFLPAMFGAILVAFPGWGVWRRRALWTLIAMLSGFLLLVSLGRGPVGVASFVLWGVVSYAFFLTHRIAFEPRQRRGEGPRPAPEPA